MRLIVRRDTQFTAPALTIYSMLRTLGFERLDVLSHDNDLAPGLGGLGVHAVDVLEHRRVAGLLEALQRVARGGEQRREHVAVGCVREVGALESLGEELERLMEQRTRTAEADSAKLAAAA